ncbi:hypothetical protein ACH5RR_006296 [Cinchona calisaya]|uniref:Uncharacterized protein n=1 Tax=Cinchona calisaya TaxID=153742 RepID=A0ABD3ANK8_9GENT
MVINPVAPVGGLNLVGDAIGKHSSITAWDLQTFPATKPDGKAVQGTCLAASSTTKKVVTTIVEGIMAALASGEGDISNVDANDIGSPSPLLKPAKDNVATRPRSVVVRSHGIRMTIAPDFSQATPMA